MLRGIEMPYFAVVVHGEGISVTSSESDEEIIGFYTTRWIEAATTGEGKRRAAKLVLMEWTEGEYAEHSRGSPPRLSIVSISRVSFLTYLRRRPGAGHTFYSSE